MSDRPVPATRYVAVKLTHPDDFRRVINLYFEERPDSRISPFGDETIVLFRTELSWLESRLRDWGVQFDVSPVRTLAELPPERAYELRRKGWKAASHV